MVQLLTPEGERTENPDYPLQISDDEIAALYRDLVLVRRIDTEAVALQRQGELGIWASCLGQEAAQVGSGRALRPHDMAFPSYRELGVAWCRDVDPATMLGLFRGTSLAGWDPFEHNFNTYTIIIGAQTLHATGYAMGIQCDGAVGTGDPERDTACLVYFGDGATSQGDVSESMVWAGSSHLPVVFFCQNNQWAISEPVERQSRIPIFERANGFGFPGVRVDGNDVLASLAVTRQALDHARSAQGPTLIEAYTYRINPHTTNDDPRRYRAASEVEAWKAKDPIDRVRKYLVNHTDISPEFFDELGQESTKLAEHLRTACRTLPEPTPESLFDNVFAEMPDELREQRDEFAEFVRSVEVGA
jgi:pyruvate dehydrogenase E1 component alpha subunit